MSQPAFSRYSIEFLEIPVISPFVKAHRLTMSGISAIGFLSHCPSHLVYASLLIAHRATWHKIVRLVIGLTVIEVVDVKGVPANGFAHQ